MAAADERKGTCRMVQGAVRPGGRKLSRMLLTHTVTRPTVGSRLRNYYMFLCSTYMQKSLEAELWAQVNTASRLQTPDLQHAQFPAVADLCQEAMHCFHVEVVNLQQRLSIVSAEGRAKFFANGTAWRSTSRLCVGLCRHVLSATVMGL